jgi:hypothetical protein
MTAVEWLLQKLFETNNNTNDAKKMDINKIIEQAKEMEKEQIINAYDERAYDIECLDDSPEEYYNYTYKK